MSPKVSVFKKRGRFFLSKSQWKGVSFNFGERSYVLPLANEWRDQGFSVHADTSQPTIASYVCLPNLSGYELGIIHQQMHRDEVLFGLQSWE